MTMQAREPGPEFDLEASLKPPLPATLPKIVQVDRLINRPIAALIVRAVRKTSILPNHLTVAAFVLSVAGAAAFLGGTHRSFILAGILIYAGTILDGADGMLARSKNLCTRFGAYLDLYLDRIGDFLVLGGMITGYYYQSGRQSFYILNLFGLAAYMLQTALYYLEREWREVRTGSGASGDFRGLVYLGIFVFAVINRLDIVIGILLCIPILNILYRFVRFWILERPSEPPH
jgi:1L-myo-inositol 1-phosphate cytidylyltransferase / CDP-L-myo-inositol myo-inositolphosphotransferase